MLILSRLSRLLGLAALVGLTAAACGGPAPVVDADLGRAPAPSERPQTTLERHPPRSVAAAPPPTTRPATTASNRARPRPPDANATRPTTPSRPTTPPPDEPAGRDEPADRTQGPLQVGDQGPAVARLQDRLHARGYWVGPRDGVYGELTRQAVYAFQAVEDLEVDGVAGSATLRALARAERPQPQEAGGDHLEIDLADQVLLWVRDGRVAWAFNTATGTNERYRHPDGHLAVADTPRGRFEVFWRVDGWRESDLGRLYRPAYFHSDGLAIHGFHEVPPHRASHGCARVSLDAMDFLWARGAVPDGQSVLVY